MSVELEWNSLISSFKKKCYKMNRQERIRLFITEQCRSQDRSYRSSLFPKQILLGDVPLPLPEEGKMTFKINPKRKICFRISLMTQTGLFHVGFPLTQIESLSFKEKSAQHPEAALVFILKDQALEKFVDICTNADPQLLDSPLADGNRRSMSKYLTVILREDKNAQGGQKNVYMRINLRGMIFTFTSAMAKKIMMKDLEIMWNAVLDKEWEVVKKYGTNYDREDKMGEMDDSAWDWFMSYLQMEWVSSPEGGLWFSKIAPMGDTLSVETKNIDLAPFQRTLLAPIENTYMSSNDPCNESSPTHEPSLLSDEFLGATNADSIAYSNSVLGSTGPTTPE